MWVILSITEPVEATARTIIGVFNNGNKSEFSVQKNNLETMEI